MLTAALVVLGVGIVSGQEEAEGSGARALLNLEAPWNEAHLRGDADLLERLWADDIVIIVPRMEPISKTGALAVLRSGRFTFETYESSETVARTVAGVGIVTGRIKRVRRMGDRSVQDDWRFTKVYVHDGADWNIVSFHASDAGG